MDTFLPERRTGARWVAATGAFLLAAAAALFVAVRWNELPDTARFGIVVAFTVACLVAGHRLRTSLPATGDALFHLGAVLLPIDLAALNLRLQMGWRGLLLAEGLLVTGVLGAMGLATGSVVLRRAGIAGGIALAAGVAAMGPVPAPLVLAVLAIAVLAARQDEAAVVWSAAAGLAPVLAGAVTPALAGHGTLTELGVVGGDPLPSLVTGLAAAGVLGRLARRRGDLALAVVTIVVLGLGLLTAWIGFDPPARAHGIAAASAFLLVELLGLAFRRDPFWRQPVDGVVRATEAAAAAGTFVVAGLLAYAPLLALETSPQAHPTAALAAALLAAAWLVAAVCRWPAVRAFPLVGAAVGGSLVVALLTERALPTGIAMAVSGGLLLVAADRLPVTRRPLAAGAAAFAVWGTVTVSDSAEARVAMGVVVALALTVGAARLQSRLLPVAATVGLAVGILSEWRIPEPTGVALVVAGVWVLAVLVDALGSRRVADVGRWSILLVLTQLRFLEANEMVAALVVATVVFAIEAVRTDDDRFAYPAAVLAQAALLAVAVAAGLTSGAPGVVLCIGAVVCAGVAALVDDDRWRRPFFVGAALGVGAGLGLAAQDGRSLATATMITGGLLLGAAIAGGARNLAHVGGGLLSAGLLGHLALAGVGVSEAYLAPVSLQLLAAGVDARRRHTVSSWETFAPPVLLLGGGALAERIASGPGWHAVLAGTVGVVAVGIGAWRRQAGPLSAGTLLVVAVTVHESLGVAAGVPTWAWLAVGGAALLATGVALERNETSPVDAGRRLVDLVSERFE